MLDAEGFEKLALLGAPSGGEDLGPPPLGYAYCGLPDAPGGGVNQHPLSLHEPAEVTQGVVCGKEGDGDGRGLLEAQALGLGHHERGARVTKEPRQDGAKATALSPISRPSTPSPTSEITPAHSNPTSGESSSTGGTRSIAIKTSLKFRPTARTRISTSPGPGFLRSVSRSSSASKMPGFGTSSREGSAAEMVFRFSVSSGAYRTSRGARRASLRSATWSSPPSDHNSWKSACVDSGSIAGSRSIFVQRSSGSSMETTFPKPQSGA